MDLDQDTKTEQQRSWVKYKGKVNVKMAINEEYNHLERPNEDGMVPVVF